MGAFAISIAAKISASVAFCNISSLIVTEQLGLSAPGPLLP